MKKWQYKPVKTVLQYSKKTTTVEPLFQQTDDFQIVVKNTLFSSHKTSCWQYFNTFYRTIISHNVYLL